jgi:hypothetical protein
LSPDGKTITITDYPFASAEPDSGSGGPDLPGGDSPGGSPIEESDPIIFTKSSGGSLDGAWYAEDNYLRMTISGNNWTLAFLDGSNYIDGAKGTLQSSGSTITFTTTHIMDFGDDAHDAEGGGGKGGGPQQGTPPEPQPTP